MTTAPRKPRIEAIYALSPMQQGMLFHSLYAPDLGMYVEQVSCTMRGDLNGSAFARAWQRVMERHTALRTAFVWELRDKLLQVIHQQLRLPLRSHDWRDLLPAEQATRLVAYCKDDRASGFNLSQAPLLRLSLIRVAEHAYYFVWTYHHLLLDGWSMSLVLKEVFTYYEAFAHGQEVALARPRSYRDYIAWLQQQDLAVAEAYWHRTLAGFTAPTPLTVERASGSEPGPMETYSQQQTRLSRETTAALAGLARQHQMSLNTMVQGAWALLLNRYSGADDIVFGVTMAGRPPELVGVETMIGLFINTLPLRVQFAPEVPLLAWLQQLQTQQIELRQYEYTPLVQVQDWSEVPRGQPLFESLLVFENYPMDASLRQGSDSLAIEDLRVHERANYPLAVVAQPEAELTLEISYDGRHFDAVTITRMLGHLATLLTGMLAEPRQRLVNVPLLTETEREQLLAEWNATQIAALPERCLHELLEAQVARTPDAVAVVFEDQQLTYQALNAWANQLGHYVQHLGVRSEMCVGLCLERSIELIVGILGVLKAGGAYVPLDPTYPTARITFMLQDAQVPVLLTIDKEIGRQGDKETETLLVSLSPCLDQVVDLSADWPIINQQPTTNLDVDVAPANLAYVIYTSGSTGTPKGVLVSHTNVTRLFTASRALFQFGEQDVWTLFHAAAFDFSVWELWGALHAGGRLIVVPYLVSRAPDAFLELLRTAQVTVLNQTPSAFRQLIPAALASGRAPALRLVIFGGEALDLASLRPWVARYGDQRPRLVNMYGITETTVHVTERRLRAADLEGAPRSRIGGALADLRLYILDPAGQPVPIGVVGELHVGGDGLARGYWDRPELTAERFIPNPFARVSGVGSRVSEDAAPNTWHPARDTRLYKTGDLARYRSDGSIEYLGRIDTQVKVRGYRIELREVEMLLAQHPAVRECVVVVREDQMSEKRLVAYVVLQPELPDYMLPSAFTLLDTLPLTPNGKLDRRALPAPDLRADASTFVAPRDRLELQLVQLWEELLNVRPIGVKDPFFALGGHSLLAVGLMARLRELTGVALPLATLFRHPTIEQLARVLRDQTALSAPSALVGIATGGSKRPLFCIHPLGGNVLCYAQLARQLAPEQPVYGIQSPGLEHDQALPTDVETMASEYVETIRTFQPAGPYLLCGWSVGGIIALEIAQQLRAQGQEVALLALLDSYLPQPLGARLPDDHRLLVGMAQQLGVQLEEAALQPLDAEQQLAYVLEQTQQSDAMLPGLDLAQFGRLFAVYKANAQALLGYAPRPYPGPVTLFRAEEAPQGQDPVVG